MMHTENQPVTGADLIPCAHCGAGLEREASGLYRHPKNDCFLWGYQVQAPQFSAWNRRAAPVSPPDGAMPEQIVEAARELMNCLDGLPIDTDEATAGQLTTFDRTRSRMQKALATQPAEGSAPVAKPLSGDDLAKLLAGKYVNDYGYRMLLNGEEVGFTLQNLLGIVQLAVGRATPERSDTPVEPSNVQIIKAFWKQTGRNWTPDDWRADDREESFGYFFSHGNVIDAVRELLDGDNQGAAEGASKP